jgi:hypothetical protein
MVGQTGGGDELQGAELVTVFIPNDYEQYVVAASILDGDGTFHFDKNLAVLSLGRGSAGHRA